MNLIEGSEDAVRSIKFGQGQKEELRKYIEEELTQAEQDREPTLRKCAAWVKQSNSRLQRPDAGVIGSNLDMALTRVRMMQNSARLKNPLFEYDTIFVGIPRNPAAEEDARAVERVNDYISDQIDYEELVDLWVEQFQTFPCGVVKTPFITETERALRWEEIEADEYNELMLEAEALGEKKIIERKLKDGNVRYFKKIDESKIIRQGAFPEVVPYENFWKPINAKDVRTAAWVAHQFYSSKYEVEYNIKAGIYNKKDDDQDVLEGLGEPESTYDPLIRPADDAKSKSEVTSKQYELFEFYTCFDCEGKGDPVEIIVTYDRNKKMFLRAVYNFYHEYKRPFVTHAFKKKIGSIDGDPLTYILEPSHRAFSASFNQRLDAASKSNVKIHIIPPNSCLKQITADNGVLLDGLYEGVIEKADVTTLDQTQPFTQLDTLEEKIEEVADQLLALNPYSWGHEQTSRPNMTGQMQLIEEGKKPESSMIEYFRKSLAEVSKHCLARYRQFFPEGLEYYIMAEGEEGKLVEKFFKWPDGFIEKDVIIETRASSSSASKSTRKQELTALVDKLPPIYQTMMGFVQVATNSAAPPGAQVAALRMIEGLRVAVDKMFTEYEIGKKDIINPDNLVKEMQIAQQWQQRFDEMAQEIQGKTQQLQKAQAENAYLKGAPAPGPELAGPPGGQRGAPGPMPPNVRGAGPPVA